MSDFNFHPQLSDRIKELNYDAFTDVQKETFPHILNDQNVFVKTGYGAGKTASFVIPIIHHLLNGNQGGIRAVIILPTRSLIYKVRKTIDMYIENTDLSYYALTKNYLEDDIQINNYDILVSTPYLMDKFNDNMDLSGAEYVVIDEVDLIHYFKQTDQLFVLMDQMQNLKQISVYSSRYNEEISRLIDKISDQFEHVSMDEKEHDVAEIDHILYSVQEDNDKQKLLRNILINEALRRIVVFVENNWTKKAVIHLVKNKLQVKTRWIDCDREQDFSDDIRLFMEGHYKILVLNNYKGQDYHLRDVNQIINYDFPEHSEEYQNRIKLLSTKSVSYKDDAVVNFSLHTDYQKKESISNALNLTFKETSPKESNDDEVVFGRVNKDRTRKLRI